MNKRVNKSVVDRILNLGLGYVVYNQMESKPYLYFNDTCIGTINFDTYLKLNLRVFLTGWNKEYLCFDSKPSKDVIVLVNIIRGVISVANLGTMGV